jgi:hypothetical protein
MGLVNIETHVSCFHVLFVDVHEAPDGYKICGVSVVCKRKIDLTLATALGVRH